MEGSVWDLISQFMQFDKTKPIQCVRMVWLKVKVLIKMRNVQRAPLEIGRKPEGEALSVRDCLAIPYQYLNKPPPDVYSSTGNIWLHI